MTNLKTLLLLTILILTLPASAQPGDITRVEDNCYDFAMRYAEQQNAAGENWGLVVEYYLPWSQEQTHYHAYQLEGQDLHIHGLYKHPSGEWKEYDYMIRGDWYIEPQTYYPGVTCYFHFWPDPSTSVRNVGSKLQIHDNRDIFGLEEKVQTDGEVSGNP